MFAHCVGKALGPKGLKCPGGKAASSCLHCAIFRESGLISVPSLQHLWSFVAGKTKPNVLNPLLVLLKKYP